jgi:hypothetical protein
VPRVSSVCFNSKSSLDQKEDRMAPTAGYLIALALSGLILIVLWEDLS